MSAAEVLQKHPERLIRSAVKGMLPRNKLGRKMLLKLKIYAGENHPSSGPATQGAVALALATMNTIEKIQYYGTGKRKTSTARVFLMPGSGQFVVNQADYQVYFHEPNTAEDRPRNLFSRLACPRDSMSTST